MAAWKHTTYWKLADYYGQYRKYVHDHAPEYRNRKEDCADISMLLLIDFASSRGLPVTFTDGNGVEYCSKANRQHPEDKRYFGTWYWNNLDEYVKAVTSRISSSNLVSHNLVVNNFGPESGDLMVTKEHTALVFSYYPINDPASGWSHPKDQEAMCGRIPVFPGHDTARTQLNQTEYVREGPYGPYSVWGYIDFLNHRGYGKERAELMYKASVRKMRDDGFQFMEYNDNVRRDWEDWDGVEAPPRP